MNNIYIKKIQIINKKGIKFIITKFIVKIMQLFVIITIKKYNNKKIYILPFYKELEEIQAKRIAKKLIRKKINENIILSKNCFRDKNLIKELEKNNIKFFDGNMLFSYLIFECIEYIGDKQSKKIEEYNISILINENISYYIDILYEISTKVKTLNIVTNHAKEFHILENKLYSQYGIAINITNNKKKSLLKSDIVINFDFDEEKINKCNFRSKQILINIFKKGIIKLKSFEGIIINNYEIYNEHVNENEFINKEMFENFFSNILYESIIFKKNNNYANTRNQIINDKIKIKKMIGINTIITDEEFKKNIL